MGFTILGTRVVQSVGMRPSRFRWVPYSTATLLMVIRNV